MKICGIILAAGEGKRAGGDKLSRYVGPKPLLEWVLQSALKANLAKLIVVTGKESLFADKLCQKYNIESIYNEKYKLGMSSSLKKGISSLPQNSEAFIVFLGDMPLIRTETINKIIQAYSGHESIVIPTYEGKWGHPRMFSTKYIEEIMNITGDMGARAIVKRHLNEVTYLKVNDPGVLIDYDYFNSNQ